MILKAPVRFALVGVLNTFVPKERIAAAIAQISSGGLVL